MAGAGLTFDPIHHQEDIVLGSVFPTFHQDAPATLGDEWRDVPEEPLHNLAGHLTGLNGWKQGRKLLVCKLSLHVRVI